MKYFYHCQFTCSFPESNFSPRRGIENEAISFKIRQANLYLASGNLSFFVWDREEYRGLDLQPDICYISRQGEEG